MGLEVVLEDEHWDALELLAARAVPALFEHLGVSGDVVVMGCDDARIAGLNADFRGKPAPTNVLSWPSEERGADEDGDQPRAPTLEELGDIALAYGTCAREAAEQGKAFEDHVTHLIVHGVLHLLGYDHERDGDAALMEGIETQILGNLGIDNPYSFD
ncbi:MAG: rRNA maturation RNase YbeY [Pseudomonadota bacterium]